MSARDALLKYSQRQLKSVNNNRAPKRKNEKPEEITVRECIDWLRDHGFSIHRVEAKAVYSKAAGRYLHSQTTPGMPDLVGNDKNGRACFIECKAKGKRSTVRHAQTEFLTEKIKTNCFVVVADTSEFLSNAYDLWQSTSAPNRQKLLLSLLPKQIKESDDGFL